MLLFSKSLVKHQPNVLLDHRNRRVDVLPMPLDMPCDVVDRVHIHEPLKRYPILIHRIKVFFKWWFRVQG